MKKSQIDPFDYEETDFTPSFFVAVIITIVIMIAALVGLAILVSSGVFAISEVLR